MIKILANDGIHPDGKILLEEANYQVDTDKVPQEELINVLPDYDVIIVRSATKVRKDLIDKCPKLKLIARGGVGLDNIDFEHAAEKNITVVNTPAASSQAVAELSFAHIFAMARSLYRSNREMPAGDFKSLKKNYSEGIQLRGRTIGILGFGRIGQEVARMALGLGMRVMPVDMFIDKAKIDLQFFGNEHISFSINLKTVSMDEMLKHSDFITLHVPSVNKPIIDKAAFDKMKKGAYIVNTARGEVIDELALIEALDSGKIAGAGLDVFENEPNPRREILAHPKICLTPHIGASTLEAQRNISLEIADKVIAFYGDDK